MCSAVGIVANAVVGFRQVLGTCSGSDSLGPGLTWMEHVWTVLARAKQCEAPGEARAAVSDMVSCGSAACTAARVSELSPNVSRTSAAVQGHGCIVQGQEMEMLTRPGSGRPAKGGFAPPETKV